ESMNDVPVGKRVERDRADHAGRTGYEDVRAPIRGSFATRRAASEHGAQGTHQRIRRPGLCGELTRLFVDRANTPRDRAHTKLSLRLRSPRRTESPLRVRIAQDFDEALRERLHVPDGGEVTAASRLHEIGHSAD